MATKETKVMKAADRKRLTQFLRPFRVTSGKDFRLADHDAGDTRGLTSAQKDEAAQMLERGIEWLADAQEKLYAQDRWGVLLVFQAMDAAGKDSTIKHVMSGVNPQGVHVTSFKAPSAEDLDHDYLWRCLKSLPERGRIGIFNRSHYEEVLVVRVHPEILARQRLPPRLVSGDIWKERCEDIAAFERYLARNGYLVLKFFLNVSADEQRKRFLARLDEPEKHWKFEPGDVRERAHWNKYMAAYEDAIRRTAAPHAPWYVVPADAKWFMRLVVAAAIVEAMDGLDLAFPEPGEAEKAAFAECRKSLLAETG